MAFVLDAKSTKRKKGEKKPSAQTEFLSLQNLGIVKTKELGEVGQIAGLGRLVNEGAQSLQRQK